MPTLNEEFETVMRAMYGENRALHPRQETDLRRLFWAGALVTFEQLMNGSSTLSEEEAVSVAERIQNEITTAIACLTQLPPTGGQR